MNRAYSPDLAQVAERELEIRNQYGVHARPATLMAKLGNKFDCEIDVYVSNNGQNHVSGKSIMGLMALGASKGRVLRIIAKGEGAKDYLDQLEKLIAGKFDED